MREMTELMKKEIVLLKESEINSRNVSLSALIFKQDLDQVSRQSYCKKLSLNNGEAYEGFMLDNQFHGTGKFTFADDDEHGRKQYVGQFENGEFHGSGTISYTNGDQCQATWNQNSMQGQGKTIKL